MKSFVWLRYLELWTDFNFEYFTSDAKFVLQIHTEKFQKSETTENTHKKRGLRKKLKKLGQFEKDLRR